MCFAGNSHYLATFFLFLLEAEVLLKYDIIRSIDDDEA